MSRERASFTFEGQRYYTSGATKEEAKAKAIVRKQEMEQGKIARESNRTVSDWAYEAVELYKTNQSPITRERYLGVLKSSVLKEIGHRPLKHVTPREIQACLNKQTGRSKSHINRVYRMLIFIFETAVTNGLIRETPCKGLVRPKGEDGTNRSVTDEERKAILAVCEDDKYLPFLLMLECGCRPSEVREIQSNDFSLVENRPLLHIRGTKTDKADRYVPVPGELYERAKDHEFRPMTKSQYNKLVDKFKNAIRDELGGTYISVTSGVYNGKHYYKKEWMDDPLAKDFRPYCLRHTYCTDLRDKGVDLRDAQYLMGHSTIAMTANIYTHSDIKTAIKVSQIL